MAENMAENICVSANNNNQISPEGLKQNLNLKPKEHKVMIFPVRKVKDYFSKKESVCWLS